MPRRKKVNNKFEILALASHLFLEKGYSNTYVTEIGKSLNISLGNLTFHFPTKEHLLADLAQHLCEYHQITLEQEVEEGRTSLLAYLLELTSMIAICEENEVAKDLYTQIYIHPMSLSLIREADTVKAKMIFAEFCPDWEDTDFILTENVVSGIEYASLMKENAETLPLDRRIAKTLNVVMRIYNVPDEIRKAQIKKVLSMDYRRIGRQFIEGFVSYVEDINAQVIKEAIKQ